MGAPVACRAAHVSVAHRVAVQFRPGINAIHARMASLTFWFRYPWYSSGSNGRSNVCHLPVTGRAITVIRRVPQASAAFCDGTRVAVIAGSARSGMKSMDGLG